MTVTFDEIENPDMESLTKTERDSILNNIGTLAELPYGSAPFLRDAGVHMPENLSNYSRNQFATEIISQSEKYEDRAEVTEVHIENDGNVKVVVAYDN